MVPRMFTKNNWLNDATSSYSMTAQWSFSTVLLCLFKKKKNDTEEAFDLIAVIGVQGKTGIKTSRMRQLKI